ncbi:MAG: hypothetical protein ABI442_02920 [Gemmatimonadaceae bacterium]
MLRAAGSAKTIAVRGGYAGILGVTMIGVSFAINSGPAPDATSEQLIEFGRAHFSTIMWGAWLQAVGPGLIIVFALSVVYLAGAMQSLMGWLTMFGAGVLMMVSLTEVVFYIAALNSNYAPMAIVSNDVAHAVQHLYFIVAAPALFLPLGAVLLGSPVLPRAFGFLAMALGAAFFLLGISSLTMLTLSAAVTSLAAVQAFWWLAAAITLKRRGQKMVEPEGLQCLPVR